MLSNNREIKFMWIPGIKPVSIPNKIPIIIEINNSRNNFDFLG